MLISIWSDKKYLKGNCHMLIPFWGEVVDKNSPDAKRFNQWKNNGKNIFKLVDSPEDSDFIISPVTPLDKNFKYFENISRQFQKKLIVFFNSDDDRFIKKDPNTLLFRTSFYKSKQTYNEYALAAWSEDFGVFSQNKKNDIPTISFCGVLDPRGIRKKSIDILSKSKNIKTSFIIRKNFWGGFFNQNISFKTLRHEFHENMKNSDYVLCARGAGNFSYRFYETLMSGRIPVFVNTDCVLPFDDFVDWFSFFPTIEYHEIDKIEERILEFHSNMDNESYIELQKTLRSLWEQFLSPTGFFQNIYRYF